MSSVTPSGDVFLAVFDQAPEKELAPGDVLIHEGEVASEVFNIVEGMLMVSRIGRDGRRQVLSFLFPDNFVGLTATEHYFFTVEAVTTTRVAGRPRSVLDEHLAKDKAAERAFTNMIFRVLENLVDLVYSLGQRSAAERTAIFVLYLRHRLRLSGSMPNPRDPAMTRIDLPMSRADIADFLGLKKETVSRSFSQLEKRGLIRRLSSDALEIADLDKLRELAGVQDFASPMRLPRDSEDRAV